MLVLHLVLTASAATLELPLKTNTGTLTVPHSMEVTVSFKGGPESAPVEAQWSNVESNSLAIACTDKVAPPADDILEQVLLQVGADRWALAPGSGVRFACAAGQKATVIDLHGAVIGTFPAPVSMTIDKAKPRAER